MTNQKWRLIFGLTTLPRATKMHHVHTPRYLGNGALLQHAFPFSQMY